MAAAASTSDHKMASPQETNEYLKKAILDQSLRQVDVLGFLRGLLPLLEVPESIRNTLRNSLLLVLDIEWDEKDKTKVTEIGVTEIQVSELQDFRCDGQVLDVLDPMTVHHVRVSENMNVVNVLTGGSPADFRYGQSQILTKNETQTWLDKIFKQRTGPEGKIRPVILMGQPVDNVTEVLEMQLGFDIEKAGFLCMTLDTDNGERCRYM
jgi:hypothetical protein